MGKQIIARGQATIVTQKDSYTINQSVGEYIFTAQTNGTIQTAVTVVSTVKVTLGDSDITNFTIGTVNKPNGFASINVNNTNKTITYTVAANTTALADNGTILIPVIIEGVTYTISFKWAKSKTGQNGAAGVGIKSIVNKYAISSSNTTVPTSWSTTVPTMTVTNRYLWNYEIVTYTNGSTNETEKRVIGVYGNTGNTGATGKGVSAVDVLYYLSTSSTTQTGGSWATTAPAWANDKYMWSKTKITYTDGSFKETSPVCITGAKGNTGNTGATGKGIKSIVEQYYLSTSNTSQAGGSWGTTPPAWTNGKYMWTRSVITYTDNSVTTTTPVCVSGSKGETGATGNGISSITEYYLASASSSGITTSTSGWTTAIQTTSDSKKYLWNYEVVQYTNGSKYTSTPVIIGTHGNTGAPGPAGKPGADGYTISASRQSYVISTDKDGKIHSAVTTNTTISVLKGSTPLTPTIGALPTVAGCTLSKNGATVTIVFNVGTSLAENGTINIPVVVDGKSFTVSFSYAKARTGANGVDSNMLDWVKDWNNNKTQINESAVITPKIFAGTKNSNGTLTGTAIGKFPLSVLNSSGAVATETINGICGFKDGYKTFYVDNTGNAGLGRGNQFIRYNAANGKIEFGSDVSLNWMNPINTAKQDAISTASSDAQKKADKAKNDAISSAATDAQKKADAAKSAAISTAANDATTKANNAKNEAINTAAKDATTKADKAKTDAINSATTTAQQKADAAKNAAISEAAKNIDNKISTLQIGGINLLKNSDPTISQTEWAKGANVTIDTNTKYQGRASFKSVQSGNSSNVWYGIEQRTSVNTAKQGDIFTASVYTYTENKSGIDGGAYMEIRYWNAEGGRITQSAKSIIPAANKAWQRFVLTGTCPAGTVMVSFTSYVTKNGTLWFNGMKLERGNKATDWSPAPEDFEASIADAKKAGTDAKQVADAITNKANSEGWSTKLTYIDSKGIFTGTLSANTVNAVKINASQITAGTISADRIAAGSITADKIKAGTITSTQLDANSIKANIINTAYINGLSCTFTKGKIGGWTIGSDNISSANIGTDGAIGLQIRTTSTGSGLWYDGAYKPAGLSMTWRKSGNAGHFVFGQIAASVNSPKANFIGIQMMGEKGVEYFCLATNYTKQNGTEIYNRIAGWAFDHNHIWKNNVSLGSDGTIANGSKWQLKNDGSGQVANGNIKWDASGNVTFGSNVSLNWTNAANNALNSAKSYADTKKTEAINSAATTAQQKADAAKNAAISAAATDATNKVNSIQIGGRNLAMGTSNEWKSYNILNGINQCWNGYGGKVYIDKEIFKVGDSITISFDVKYSNIKKQTTASGEVNEIRLQGSGNMTSWNYGFPGVKLISYIDFTKGSGEFHVSYTSKLDATHLKNSYFDTNIRHDRLTGTISVRNFKVEKGTKATTWSPAPEDTQSRLTKIDANGIYTGTINASQITAGTINAGRIDVNALKGSLITAGNIEALTLNIGKGKIGGWNISGSAITKNSVSLGSDGSITNGTKWKLNNDGSGQLANGNIKWDAAGKVTFSSTSLPEMKDYEEFVFDLSKLDQNTYYPIWCYVDAYTITSFEVFADLYEGAKPSWGTHQAGGFSLKLACEVSASDWGEFANYEMNIKSFDYYFTKDNLSPITHVGQLWASGVAYFHPRGGGKYIFKIKRSAWTTNNPLTLETSRKDFENNEYIAPFILGTSGNLEVPKARLTYIDQNGIYTGTLTANQVNAANCNFTQGKIGGFTIYGHKMSTYDNPENGHIIEIHKTGYICNSRQSDNRDYWALNADGSASFGMGSTFFNATGGFSMTGNSSSRFNINIDGNNFFRVNDGSMVSVRGDGRTALSVSTYGSNNSTRGISIICNAGGYGKAIESYGNVILQARNTEAIQISGLCVNARNVSSGSLYTNDDFVVFTNSSALSISMPNAKTGKVLYTKRVGNGNVTLLGTFVGQNATRTQTNYSLDSNIRFFIKGVNGYWYAFFCG